MNKKGKRIKSLNAITTALEILLLLTLVIGYLTQFIVYSSRTVMYLTNKNNYTSYREIFYDIGFTSNDDEENFEYLYNLTTRYDRDLIKSGSILDSEVAIFAWTMLFIRIIWVIVLILLCEIIRRLTQTKKFKKFYKLKWSLIISFLLLVIGNLIIAIWTPFETSFLDSLVIYFILYSLVEVTSYLVNDKEKEKIKKE